MHGFDKERVSDLLLSGEIDLAIGMFPEQGNWLRRRALFRETHVCAYDRRQVPCEPPITLDQYVAYPHLLVSLKGDRYGFVDRLLERQGRKRRVALTTPYFLLVGHLLAQLPLLATVPRSYALHCSTTEGLAICPVPLEVPEFDISLLSRASDERDPAMRELVSLVVAASASCGL